ncbi:hypothetical protein BCR37DRAFT_203025 [Protomyces lactucae-debilis]|uniref:Uncharacterized protein n=1 Tax=Protomyces lactucae-debilis TaxID=2754530 RepID=A0A1Y2EUU9_PROLT|nr:uncharacterized protein BCR37DRAFT_203025 [Protomyces lactucae-debilis]ORY74625.1 hypothetical protein BCR37DRAFT_203025 [Protomyces lactucae-debilis]
MRSFLVDQSPPTFCQQHPRPPGSSTSVIFPFRLSSVSAIMFVREFQAANRRMQVQGVSWTSLLGVLSAICSTLAAVFYMHMHTVDAVPGRTAADDGQKPPMHRDGKPPLWDDRPETGGNGLTRYPATAQRRSPLQRRTFAFPTKHFSWRPN